MRVTRIGWAGTRTSELKLGASIGPSGVNRLGEGHVKVDLDLLAEPEGAKKCRVGPDSPSALDDPRPTSDPAVGHTALDRDRPGDAHDRQLTVEGERPRRPVDPPGPEGDGWMLGGVEDLLEGLADLCAVGVGERLDAAGSLPDLEGVDVDLDALEAVGCPQPPRSTRVAVAAAVGRQSLNVGMSRWSSCCL